MPASPDSHTKHRTPASDHDWTACSDYLPPNDVEVMTKIHDHAGARNEQPLKRKNNLWFFPDMSMYVYYRPTHWARK